MQYTVRSFGHSDVGLVRENNEDVWAELPELGFYVVADGMGGHQAGEVASREAVDIICDLMERAFYTKNRKKGKTLLDAHSIMQEAIEDVNQRIYEMGASDKTLRGMGTTLCCLYVHEQGIIYGHVGDSRIYRFRAHHLEQLTKDHSLLSELLDLGQIQQGDKEEFLYKNIVTKAIGTEVVVEPSVHLSDIQAHDIYLLCSDGLSDIVTQKEMQQVLAAHANIDEAGLALIDLANKKGGPDNITVLLLEIGVEDERQLSR